MSFVSTELKFCGFRYGGTIYTVQDLECDPTGHIIYAEGTIKSFRLTGGVTQEDIRYINNRGFRIVNGQKSYSPPFYTQADTQACLTNLLHTMHRIGRQAT
jgi:hypothetical protein